MLDLVVSFQVVVRGGAKLLFMQSPAVDPNFDCSLDRHLRSFAFRGFCPDLCFASSRFEKDASVGKVRSYGAGRAAKECRQRCGTSSTDAGLSKIAGG